MVVGCAGSKYTDAGGQQAILVCNYGFGNMKNVYVYETGPTASKCKTGTNPDYPALCSVDEDYKEEQREREAWDLKPIMQPGGGFSYKAPAGSACEEDPTGDCQRMKADPAKFFKKYLKPKPTQAPSVSIGPDGGLQASFDSKCDQACQKQAFDNFFASHPEIDRSAYGGL